MKERQTSPTLVIKLNGYEYHLVEVDRMGHTQPRFMGHPNMALKYCKKIVKEKNNL